MFFQNFRESFPSLTMKTICLKFFFSYKDLKDIWISFFQKIVFKCSYIYSESIYTQDPWIFSKQEMLEWKWWNDYTLTPKVEECELGSESTPSLCSPEVFKFLRVVQVRLLASPEQGGESFMEGIKRSSPESVSSNNSSNKFSSRLPMKNEVGSEMSKCCCIMRFMDITSLA